MNQMLLIKHPSNLVQMYSTLNPQGVLKTVQEKCETTAIYKKIMKVINKRKTCIWEYKNRVRSILLGPFRKWYGFETGSVKSHRTGYSSMRSHRPSRQSSPGTSRRHSNASKISDGSYSGGGSDFMVHTNHSDKYSTKSLKISGHNHNVKNIVTSIKDHSKNGTTIVFDCEQENTLEWICTMMHLMSTHKETNKWLSFGGGTTGNIKRNHIINMLLFLLVTVLFQVPMEFQNVPSTTKMSTTTISSSTSSFPSITADTNTIHVTESDSAVIAAEHYLSEIKTVVDMSTGFALNMPHGKLFGNDKFQMKMNREKETFGIDFITHSLE